jgi:hypothetical protein
MCCPRFCARLRPSAVRVPDNTALHVREAAEYREHQPPGAGVGRLGEGAKLRLGAHDPIDDAEQVKGAARQPVNPRHRHHVAGGEALEH